MWFRGKVCGFWGNFNGKLDEGVEIQRKHQSKRDFETELGQKYVYHGGTCDIQPGPADISKCEKFEEYRKRRISSLEHLYLLFTSVLRSHITRDTIKIMLRCGCCTPTGNCSENQKLSQRIVVVLLVNQRKE